MLGAKLFTIVYLLDELIPLSLCNDLLCLLQVSNIAESLFYLKSALSDVSIGSSALFGYNLIEISSPSLHFHPMCVLKAKVSLLQAANHWREFYPFSRSVSFDWRI